MAVRVKREAAVVALDLGDGVQVRFSHAIGLAIIRQGTKFRDLVRLGEEFKAGLRALGIPTLEED